MGINMRLSFGDKLVKKNGYMGINKCCSQT